MFTGIVREKARVASFEKGRLVVESSLDAATGDSVAVDGVCLTVVERDGGALAFDLAEETRRRTALQDLRPGDPVNLERAVTPLTRLGGHLVQGHVDGVGRVVSVAGSDGDGAEMMVEAPAEVARYLVEKGSVAVDGVSLTVAAVDGSRFRVALIPHTLEATTLGVRTAGDTVNLEVDVVAKYVERFVGTLGRP